MPISVFDLFKVGIGPSSSHTVGPMWAAHRFLLELDTLGTIGEIDRVQVDLYGSLALTGKGHATDRALILGLSGEVPDQLEPDHAQTVIDQLGTDGSLVLAGSRQISFDPERDIIYRNFETLPQHSNGMTFFAYDQAGEELLRRTYFSVGGGFIVGENDTKSDGLSAENVSVPYPFTSAAALLDLCEQHQLSIPELVMANELAMRSQSEIDDGLDRIWHVMESSIQTGCHRPGILPGGLKVPRRAPELFKELSEKPEVALRDPLTIIDWVNLYALAVNEENAAGGRVVTAPTNGAAGVIPAVLNYYCRFIHGANTRGIRHFLLTSAAIGMLYKENASISAAEVGCQGEVGVACSMAAGALCSVLGGTNRQIENAAEIGMEHNLGLTCDPIAGLVQIPCIERNTMGAVKAINAARLALRGDGTHFVSLDKVIETMRQTGRDMSTKYKETSLGGLAVNIVEC